MNITLIRHGQTDWNRDRRLQGITDIPLNETGRTQARDAALTPEYEWDIVVSSPLGRARETALLLAETLGIDIGPVYESLIERSFGDAEGCTSEEVQKLWPHGDYPGMETPAEAALRGQRALAEIARDFPDKRVLAVSHGAFIRATASAVRGEKWPPIANLGTVHLGRAGETWATLSAPVAR